MQNIEQNNALIAEFMGWEKYVGDGPIRLYKLGNDIKHINTLNYNSSWDLLIPVVQKIHDSDVYWDVYISLYPTGFLSVVEIGSVYDDVIHFINWYNKNKS